MSNAPETTFQVVKLLDDEPPRTCSDPECGATTGPGDLIILVLHGNRPVAYKCYKCRGRLLPPPP
jgi:hypothetical protein